MPSDLPAGWYTDDAGNRRYWTGDQWVSPEASTAAPASGDGTIQASTPHRSRRRVYIAAGALGLAGVAVLVAALTMGGRGTSEPAQATSAAPTLSVEEIQTQACVQDFAWAIDTITADPNGGPQQVMYEWGSEDGRMQQAFQFYSAFAQEQARHGTDAATGVVLEDIREYCSVGD